MKTKFNVKSLVIGGIVGGMLMSGVSYAASQLTTIEVSMNPLTFMHNGEQLELETGKQSFIYEGSTYVPLRWLSESIGKTVEWDEQNRIINIIDQVVEEDVDEKLNQTEGNNQEEGTVAVATQLTLDKEAYAPTDTLQLTITNDSSSTLSFGRSIQMEQLTDGEWIEVPVNIPMTMELIILGENDTFTQNIDLSQIDLQAGTYKLTKHVFDEDNELAAKISALFEVTVK